MPKIDVKFLFKDVDKIHIEVSGVDIFHINKDECVEVVVSELIKAIDRFNNSINK